MIEQMPIDCETCGGGGTAQSKWNGDDVVCPECGGKGFVIMEIQEISPDDIRAIWGAYADLSEGNMDTVRTTLHHFKNVQAWECKDFADSWIRFSNLEAALAYQYETSCIMRPIWK